MILLLLLSDFLQSVEGKELPNTMLIVLDGGFHARQIFPAKGSEVMSTTSQDAIFSPRKL